MPPFISGVFETGDFGTGDFGDFKVFVAFGDFGDFRPMDISNRHLTIKFIYTLFNAANISSNITIIHPV